MNSRNASGEVVLRIEKGSIRIGDLQIQREHFGREGVSLRDDLMDTFQNLNGSSSPDRPVAQQSAHDTKRWFGIRKAILGDQVQKDVVIVAGVESNLWCPARFSHSSHDIQCPVSIKRGHLDGHDILHLRKPAPEIDTQDTATHRGLEVEAKDGDDLGDGLYVLNQVVV